MKQFSVKIYDSLAVFQKNISPNLIQNRIQFDQKINGGQGQLIIDLAINFDEPPTWTEKFNFIRVYESDEDNSSRLIYSGWISQRVPYFFGNRQGIKLVCLGLVSLMSLSLYKDGASFDVVQSAVDPGAVIDDIISTFQGVYPPSGGFEWIGSDAQAGIRDGGNVDTVGTNIAFTYEKNTWQEASQKTTDLADPDWYWFVDKGGDFFFKEKAATADHTFIMGRHINSIEIPDSIEDVVNDVTVAYDGGTENATDATSITAYGKREKYINESANTSDSTTAQQRATKEVEDNKNAKIEATLVLNNTFDIESIRPGQTCKILNFKKGASILGENMKIVSTNYDNGETLSIELERVRTFRQELQNFVDGQ